MPVLLRLLRKRLLESHALTLGVALRQDAVGPEFAHLAQELGAASIFLLPPRMTEAQYRSVPYSYFSEGTLVRLWELYHHGFNSSYASSICYMLPAETYSFKVHASRNFTATPQVPAIGPGVKGSATGQPGRMAYFETCRIVTRYQKIAHEYGMVAARHNSWLSFTTPPLLSKFIAVLHNNLSASCLGLWNPQWDDFADICGHKMAYPLLRTVFKAHDDSNI
ncbi:putative chitinase 10 [Haemaphysalis longicornis]